MVPEDPGHPERALGEVTILRRISTRVDNMAESTMKEEISGKKVVTTTLNALLQTSWSHLWGNDIGTMPFQFTTIHKASKRS